MCGESRGEGWACGESRGERGGGGGVPGRVTGDGGRCGGIGAEEEDVEGSVDTRRALLRVGSLGALAVGAVELSTCIASGWGLGRALVGAAAVVDLVDL